MRNELNMQKAQAVLQAGANITERYGVVDVLGQGGFSIVYLVKDEQDGALFALKELTDQDKIERARFTFECEVLERLDHPALPRVHAVFEENDHAYMLMDYVAGPNLETLRRRQPGNSFALSRALTIMEPIIKALEYLHSQQPPIIHRDIKPSNIIVPQEGGSAVLVDFGIAKEYSPDSTTTAIRHCSPGYGAPEQYSLGTDLRTDIYGLGATFYALLTGTIPVDSLQRATKLGTQGIDPLTPMRELAPAVPEHVARAIQRAMSIGPDQRFNSIDDFWQAANNPSASVSEFSAASVVEPSSSVSRVRDTGPIVAKVSLRLPRMKKAGMLTRAILALLVILFVGAGVSVGAWAYTSGSHSRHTALTMAGMHTAQHPTPTSSTSAAGVYPDVAHPYTGTVHDILSNASTSMTLTHIQQNGAVITGTFSGLSESASFSGVLDTVNHVIFTVAASNGHTAMFFQGVVRPDHNLAGNYCNVDSAGQCVGDYGIWSVAPGK